MKTTRSPAVAGTFYPAETKALNTAIDHLLNEAKSFSMLPLPTAIIAPHAGYIYSGSTTAAALATLAKARDVIRNVIIIGPSHAYPVEGIATSSADYFATPLGEVPLNQTMIKQLLILPQIMINDAAHKNEHCIEVMLPFLQKLLKDFAIIPLLVGQTTPEKIAAVLTNIDAHNDTIIIVSSDLSHYLGYETAKKIDQHTIRVIMELKPQQLTNEDACGCLPIKGLLTFANQQHLHAKLIMACNSGDTAGPKDQVVGYAAIHFL